MAEQKAVVSVSVSDVRRSPEGHTLYFVSLMSNRDASDDSDDDKQTSVWRRYSTIMRFHHQVQALLRSNQIDVELPSLPKAKFFNRFDVEVVEERRLASERFLQRALRLPTVVSSSVLLAFLAEERPECGKKADTPTSLDIEAIVCDGFHPTLVSPAEAQPPSPAARHTDSNSSVSSLPDVPDIPENGFLQSFTPRTDSSLSLEEMTSPDHLSTSTGRGAAPGVQSPLCLSPVDNLSPSASSVWLNRAVSPSLDAGDEVDAVVDIDVSADDNAGGNATQTDLLDLSVLDEQTFMEYSSASDCNSVESLDNYGQDEHDGVEVCGEKADDTSPAINSDTSVANAPAADGAGEKSHRPAHLCISGGTSEQIKSMGNSPDGSDPDQFGVEYIVNASRIISKAVTAEGKSQFTMAYDFYISGVGVLLSGVQTDKNAFRRDAVRHKTAQYLQRAEVLQRAHSSDEQSNHLREEVSQLPYRPNSQLEGKQSTALRVLSALESPPASLSYLANVHQHSSSLGHIERPVHVGPRLLDYRVLRPVGKCMLVENKYTGDVYLIKSLAKSQPTASLSSTKRSRCLMKYLCPYMVKPIGHFETTSTVFLLLEYAQRGCLWDQLSRFRQDSEAAGSDAGLGVPERQVRRWAAQLVVALSHLHFSGFIWKDLQSRNLLLSEEGMLLLTYAGTWEHVERHSSWWAGKNLYQAPELSRLASPTPASDWWSVGVLVYELLTGKSLLSVHPGGVHSYTGLHLPAGLSERSKSLLKGFLQANPTERLGAGVNGVEDIKAHPFFAKIRGWHT